MKKLLLFVFAALAFAACTQDVVVEITPAPIVDEVPETLVVGFEGDDTRIQLQNGKTVWTKGDLVSVFYKSDGNDCWKFTGETGERNGTLQRVSVGEYSRRGDYVIVAYPYNRDYLISLASNTIETTLPAVQEYATGSFGVGSSPMVGMGDYKQFALKNTCGWLKLQLTGNGEMVRSITLRGNNGEQVAGDILIVAEDASVVLADASIDVEDNEVGGSLLGDDDILKEVTLDCGEGVTLGKSATAFYIALPPQTFTKGLTVEITDGSGYTMTQATDKVVAIERNHIQPMAEMEFTLSVPNNQIWYTSTDVVEPYNIDAFGATIISNEWNSETGKGIITFDGDVTTIAEYAFWDCYSLTSVTIGNSVTTIGNGAFYSCDSLTSVNIPDSVTTIGDFAFEYCKSLTSVNIPDGVTTIGEAAFSRCTSFTSVNIGNSITTIGWNAFAACSNLKEFTGKYAADGGRCLIIDNTIIAYAEASGTTYNIPESVTTIGYAAFAYCYSLTSVNIPDSVTTIGDAAFNHCDSLTSVNIPDSVTTIGWGAFYDCSSLTSVNIPDSVTTIGWGAFSGCTSLTSVNIPDNVTTIGQSTFSGCTSLTSVNIPDNVTTIGDAAFADCSKLREFTGKYAADGGRCLIIDNTIIAYAEASGTTYNIPDSVTSIGSSAFIGCNSLTSVNIPNSVTTIGVMAFRDCDSLTSVNIPDRVTTIGQSAFYNCHSLTSVNIPDSVTTIGDYAFDGCILKYVYCKPTTPPALGGSNVFGYNASGRRIIVPIGSGEAYKTAEYWSEYANDIFEDEF